MGQSMQLEELPIAMATLAPLLLGLPEVCVYAMTGSRLLRVQMQTPGHARFQVHTVVSIPAAWLFLSPLSSASFVCDLKGWVWAVL